MTRRLLDPPVDTRDDPDYPFVLEVELEPGDDSAALRVLSLLARRRCRVRRAAFTLGDKTGRSTLTVELEAAPRRAATVERWVSGLVSVRQVSREQS